MYNLFWIYFCLLISTIKVEHTERALIWQHDSTNLLVQKQLI